MDHERVNIIGTSHGAAREISRSTCPDFK